jgi:hypothetical protein
MPVTITQFLKASSSSDGTVIIWDADSAEIVHKVDGIIPMVVDQDSEEFKFDCSVVWHPNGVLFYLPSKSHGETQTRHSLQLLCQLILPDVACYKVDGWTREADLTDSSSSGVRLALYFFS